MPEPRYHQTAGGIVANARGEFLVLVRDVVREGKTIHEVRLPKGHIDAGETEAAAARREVLEESGYGATEIVADLGTARSFFHFRDEDHVRDERYFLMRLTEDVREAPQPTHADEALFQPQWLSPAAAVAALSYESEQDFARRAIVALEEEYE